ncbi:hypothetical protein CB1_000731018 [Camelus ferus]|nr:hypothetical protein CB1_000731018 [Camelus ferus]
MTVVSTPPCHGRLEVGQGPCHELQCHFCSKDGSWKLQLAEFVYVNKENAVYAKQLENNQGRGNLTGIFILLHPALFPGLKLPNDPNATREKGSWDGGAPTKSDISIQNESNLHHRPSP